jgi:hypothetical protein
MIGSAAHIWDEDTLLTQKDVLISAYDDGDSDISLHMKSEMAGDIWQDAINNALLVWLRNPETYCEYSIEPACLESALDFAIDQMGRGMIPPTSISPTSDGEVCFEWRHESYIFVVTIYDHGQAEYTTFDNCVVVDEGILVRDPITRKLQLQQD